MNPIFEIGVLDMYTGQFVGIQDPGISRQDLGDTTFRLTVDGQEYVGEAWSLGPLELLVRQLEHVSTRLQENRVALLRSGVEEQIEVPYFLFEPDGVVVRVSAFLIPDRSMGSVFPIDIHGASQAHGERLYDYVREHRRELLDAGDPDTFRELACPRTALLRDMESEISVARKVWLP